MLHSIMRSLGHALRPFRPGPALLASSKFSGFLGYAITVSSPAFQDRQAMPVRFTQDGAGLSPSLQWDGLPPQTQSVVLLVEDADIPLPKPLTHLIVHGIPPDKTVFGEGEIPFRQHGAAPGGWMCGRNALARPGWSAPTPPPGHGPHRYAFQVFALNARPRFAYPPGRRMLLRTIRPHLIGQGRLIGTYERL